VAAVAISVVLVAADTEVVEEGLADMEAADNAPQDREVDSERLDNCIANWGPSMIQAHPRSRTPAEVVAVVEAARYIHHIAVAGGIGEPKSWPVGVRKSQGQEGEAIRRV